MREIAASEAEKATAVFEGKVVKQEMKPGGIDAPKTALSMNLVGAHRVVTIDAKRVYRGSQQGRLVVLTAINEAGCGFDFETEQEYLIFSSTTDNGELVTSLCTATDLLGHSGPALRYLRGEPSAPEDLLDSESYWRRMLPQWTGKVCGRVSKPDGTPLGGAVVDLSQLRDDSFPPKTFGDPDTSKPNGSFCIQAMPGAYLLTAWKTDYDDETRLMGYYPGVAVRSEAKSIHVSAEATIADLQLKTLEQPLYEVRIQVVMADGSPLPWESPWEHLDVVIESSHSDPLSYHAIHGVHNDGSFTFHLVPPGHYSVAAYVHPSVRELLAQQQPSDLSKWQPVKQEVKISGDAEVVLKLVPAS